jgi:hypothetical protein
VPLDGVIGQAHVDARVIEEEAAVAAPILQQALISRNAMPLYPHGSTKNRVGTSLFSSNFLTISSPTSPCWMSGRSFSVSWVGDRIGENPTHNKFT